MSERTETAVLDEALPEHSAQDISACVKRLFSMAAFIALDPGMTNDFSMGLAAFIEKHGKPALRAVQELVLNEETASSIALEALQYIGNSDSKVWHDERRKMLERCLLASRSAWARDGAGLGLASLDDPQSIPALEMAIAKESNQELREDLLQVLEQLKDTLLES